MGLAQTGTGKTAAFVLPILQRLMSGRRRRIRAIIIAPTRELADQTQESVRRLGAETGLKGVVIYGGVNQRAQVNQLRDGADIIVACPGRLLDLMVQGEVKVSDLEMLVLDEADRMFDMGFLPDIRKIMKRLPAKRQTLLFSATMPEDIRRLTEEMMQDAAAIRINDNMPVSTVSHAVYPVEAHLKTALLMKLLDHTDTESVLVFTRTRSRATHLAGQMKKAGFIAASLQGDMPQTKRQEALSGFRSGKYRVLVATDIAARGIDVSRVSHVINYDMPDTVDAYTHRIGRTGRAARTGDAFSFVTQNERSFVWDIEKTLGEKLEKRMLADFNYGIPAPENHDGRSHSGRSSRSKAASRFSGDHGYSPARRVLPAPMTVGPSAGFRPRRKSSDR